MSTLLQQYAEVVGEDVIEHLYQLAARLRGRSIVHVNSTREGGGVAEILHKIIPLMKELGLETRWEVVEGTNGYYQCTKGMHNGLQGMAVDLRPELLRAYEETNAENAEKLRSVLEPADVVFIHDPQPAALLQHMPERRGKWLWRCHIDASHPYRPVWRYLRPYVSAYDASIFSIAAFAQPLPHPQYLVAPSIDPLSEKNMELAPEEVDALCGKCGIDRSRPFILQVSRYDRFKDPVGVIRAYRMAKRYLPAIQLVLAGGGASDDPEGEAVLAEVRQAAADDPDIHVLLLPSDAHRTINALQRGAHVVLQKSLREGFGLTVTEALWKGRPVIGGDTGGIRLQVINHHTGFLVSSPEGAALRIRYFLHNAERREEMGRKGREYVRENFLITRHLREHLTLIMAMEDPEAERVDLA